MLRAALPLAVLLLVALPVPGPAHTETYRAEEATIRAHDGVELRATVFVPTSPGPHAAVILPHGFGDARDQEAGHARHFAEKGWVALTYDARGFGESGGRVELDGPSEVADVRTLVDWLADRADVRLDAPGDPRVAMRGGSYGGAIQLLAAAADTRIDALVPLITWNDLTYSLAPRGVLKTGWVHIFHTLGLAAGHGLRGGNPNPDGLDPKLTEYYLRVAATQALDDEVRDYLEARSPGPVLAQVRAPALLVQGWRDTLFNVNEAGDTFAALRARGVPAKLLVYPGGHGYDEFVPQPVRDQVEARIDAWLAFWLDGHGAPEDVYAAPVEWWSEAEDRFVAEQAWPVADATPFTLWLEPGAPASDGGLRESPPSSAGRTLVAAVPAGSYSEVPAIQPYVPAESLDAEGATAVFTGPPLEEAHAVVGEPRLVLLSVASAGPVVAFLKLYDVSPEGNARLVDRQVTPVSIRADALLGSPVPQAVELTGVGHTFEAGHRVRVSFTTSDAAYAQNRLAAVVAIDQDSNGTARLELPLHPAAPRRDVTPPVTAVEDVLRVGPDVSVTVNATDDVGVASVLVVWRGGELQGVAAPVYRADSRFEFRLADVPEGSEYRALASDAAGNHASSGAATEPGPEDGSEPWALVPGPSLVVVAAFVLGVASWRRRRSAPPIRLCGPPAKGGAHEEPSCHD